MNLYIRMLLALTLIGSGPALGHSMAPALLELEADSGGRVIARLKQNLTQTLSEPDYPPQCRVSREFPPEREEDAVWRRWQLHCENEGLPEGRVGWAELTEINVVLRLIPASGTSSSVLLHRNRPSYHIAEQPGASEQFMHAVSSGMSHLFVGLDHLLFIIGLVFYLGWTRALVIAATLFTVGHSLTLAAVTLGLVRVPVALAELAIAGSILYLAVSLLKSRCLPANPGWANVMLMPTGFGLLHGMGFASVLASSGLGSGDLLINLLGFNVGIELGQLVCIGAMLLLSASVRYFEIASRWRAAVAPTLVWMVGSVAAYWWWERTLELLI